MLARLELLDGIGKAETDYAGDFLRLTLDDRTPPALAIELLASLGYLAEPAEAALVRDWYDAQSVGKLSFVEAGVIADRVLSQLADEHPLAPDVGLRLRAAVVEALHACFTKTTLETSTSNDEFHDECARAAFDAAVPVIGPAPASVLARLLDADMRQLHRNAP